jgi:6-phosphogluconate dehydrogenase
MVQKNCDIFFIVKTFIQISSEILKLFFTSWNQESNTILGETTKEVLWSTVNIEYMI